jgi:hypothetical protein
MQGMGIMQVLFCSCKSDIHTIHGVRAIMLNRGDLPKGMKLEGYTREIWPFDRLRINGIYRGPY